MHVWAECVAADSCGCSLCACYRGFRRLSMGCCFSQTPSRAGDDSAALLAHDAESARTGGGPGVPLAMATSAALTSASANATNAPALISPGAQSSRSSDGQRSFFFSPRAPSETSSPSLHVLSQTSVAVQPEASAADPPAAAPVWAGAGSLPSPKFRRLPVDGRRLRAIVDFAERTYLDVDRSLLGVSHDDAEDTSNKELVARLRMVDVSAAHSPAQELAAIVSRLTTSSALAARTPVLTPRSHVSCERVVVSSLA